MLRPQRDSRGWRKHFRPLPVFLLEAWFGANALCAEPAEPPPVRVTWKELEPSHSFRIGGLEARDLQGLDDWLTLAQILATHDPDSLERFGFYEPGPSCSWPTWRSTSAKWPIPSWLLWPRACCAGSGSSRRVTTGLPGRR